jgi:hypothetical protein
MLKSTEVCFSNVVSYTRKAYVSGVRVDHLFIGGVRVAHLFIGGARVAHLFIGGVRVAPPIKR